MDLLYTLEKLRAAVHALAVGGGAIKDRLYDAFLEFHMLRPDDFPPELCDDFRWVKHELVKRHGGIGPSLKGMRLNKAEEIAERVCYLESCVLHGVNTEESAGWLG